MKRWSLFITLLCISALFTFLYRHQETETSKASPSPIKVKTVSSQNSPERIIVNDSQVASDSPSIPEKQDSNIDPDRDYLLWSKVSNEIEEEWNKEIYTHIQYFDREHADVLYQAYLKEREIYLTPTERDLSDDLNELSKLNGESIDNWRKDIDPQIHEEEFIQKLRKIFRQNYGYLEGQRKIFLDNHSNN